MIVEDEVMIVLELEMVLREAGCEVVGAAAGLEEALYMAQNAAVDAAMLDIHVGDRDIFPVADALVDRGIPFVFLTGYGPDRLPAHLRQRPIVNKPYSIAHLLETLGELIEDAHPAPH